MSYQFITACGLDLDLAASHTSSRHTSTHTLPTNEEQLQHVPIQSRETMMMLCLDLGQ